MLTIRLFRIGKKNQPAFKIVVTDSRRSSTRGRFVEEVGVYNPLSKQRNLKGDRIKYWISQGAQPSATVHNMLVADKVIEGKKIAKHKLIPAKPPAEAAPQPSTSTEVTVDTSPEATAGTATPIQETPVTPEEKPA